MRLPSMEIPDTTLVRQSIASLFLCALVTLPAILSYRPVKLPVMLEKIVLSRAVSDKEIVRGDTTKMQVMFTFDGGDGAQSADQILTVLAKHRVKGTFFLTGRFVEQNPDLVRRIAAAGHEIFSHTYDHPHLTQLSDADIAAEFAKMEDVLMATAGVSPRPYFRAPYGDRDPRVLADAYKAGYQSVYWSIDGHDWEETLGTNADQVRAQILDNLAPGTIYLMHLGDTITGAVLDDLFTTIESRGYKIVSLTQGL